MQQHLSKILRFQTLITGSRNPALRSSNEYSISSGIIAFTTRAGTDTGAGVMAVCIGTDMVGGVDGMGTGIVLGVLFSSPIPDIFFVGVEKKMLLPGRVFCNSSFDFGLVESSGTFEELFFVGIVVDMGKKGFRVIGDSGSQALAESNECFFTGRPATSNPLPPAKTCKT